MKKKKLKSWIVPVKFTTENATTIVDAATAEEAVEMVNNCNHNGFEGGEVTDYSVTGEPELNE